MGELLSWHRVGQKVQVLDSHPGWTRSPDAFFSPVPDNGEVYEISLVQADAEHIWFCLREMFQTDFYRADHFRPVYPTAIDALRKLEAPVDHSVRENA